jgi:hypothetical protein
MPQLRFMPAVEAFNRIGATREDGSPYRAVRGVSVSKRGLHFRFWESDIHAQDDRTLELRRRANPSDPWRSGPQGRAFYDRLVEARNSGVPIFVSLNKRGKDDANGKATVNAAAPVLTAAGNPAPGRVLIADVDSGELCVIISLSAQAEASSKIRFIDQFDVLEAPVTVVETISARRSRDKNVRLRVLARAGGTCERLSCGQPAFRTFKGLYLETHHVIALSENGRDATDNVVALCANCHRMAHHSTDHEAIRDELRGLMQGR